MVILKNLFFHSGPLRRLSFSIPTLLLLAFLLGFVHLSNAEAADPGGAFLFPAQWPVAPDGNDQHAPALSGDIVIWHEYDAGLRATRIFFNDLSKDPEEPGRALISDQESGEKPAISRNGNRVVWAEGVASGLSYHIYSRDVDFSGNMECIGTLDDCQASAVSPTYYWQENPAISPDGSKVAWENGRSHDSQIHMYDFNTGIEQEVYGMPDGDQMFPSVDDEWIVWLDWRNYNDLSHANDQAIYAKQIGAFGPPVVIASFQNDGKTNLSGAKLGRNIANEPIVVYVKHETAPPYGMSNLETIYVYNLATGINQIVKQTQGYTANLESPSVDGDKLVWIDRTTNSRGDLVFYNLSTGQETVISQDPALGANSPSVSNDTGNIVWASNNGNPYTIYSNRIGDTAQMLADRYKPELRMTSEENPFEPMPIEQFLMEHDEFGNTWLEQRNHPEFFIANPTAAVLAQHATTPDLYLDFPGSSVTAGGGDPSCTIDDRYVHFDYFKRYQKSKNNNIPTIPVIYTRVVSRPAGNENSFIQYWIFYAANNHPDLFHEGDWELVQVDLDANLQPLRANYSQHGNGSYRNWDGPGSVERKDGSPNTPVVYVAQGSHANYFRSHDKYYISLPLLQSWDVAIANGNTLNLPTMVIPEVEQSEGTAFEWLLYQGQWGEYTAAGICNGQTGYRDGPSNPPVQSYWINAFEWASDLDSCDSCKDELGEGTNTQATAHSPVDIHFYDAQGRHTGKNADGSIDEQIPNSEYFEYPDLHRKSIIIRDSDIHAGFRFEAVGNGSGPADFIVTAPDHAAGSVDTLNYNAVTVNPSTRVTMNLDEVKDYTMAVDTNGDGSDVIQKEPDAFASKTVDFIAPAQVTDLSASSAAYGSATLSFTAPGDDADQGTARAYIIRYSTSAITEQYLQDTLPLEDDLPAPMTAGSSETITASGLIPGNTYYFVLKAIDDVSLSSPLSNVAAVYIPTDSTPPVISNALGGWVATGSPAITAHYSDIDPSSGVDTASATISINGGAPLACSAADGTISCNLNGLSNGHYDYTLSIADDAGNTGMSTSGFDVDTAAPVLNGHSPTGIINTGSATIATSYADAGSGINVAGVQVSLDGEAIAGCTTTSSGVSCQVAGLSDGIHAFSVTVGDAVGNTATATNSFSVDTTPPSISNILPGGNGNSSSPTVSASYSDALSGINTSSATARLDGAALPGCAATAPGISCPSSGLTAGIHTIIITVSDNAANTSSASRTFNVVRNYYWSWYDHQTSGFQNEVLFANPYSPNGASNLWFGLFIAGTQKPLTPLWPGLAPGEVPMAKVLSASYPGVINGPVKAVSLTGEKAVLSQLTTLASGDFEAVPATEEGRLSSQYFWPWYDNTNGLTDWVLVAPHTNDVYYEITVGNAAEPQRNGTISAGGHDQKTIPGLMSGPVELKAWTDASRQVPSQVIASQRVTTANNSSLNEVPGIPAQELSSTYLWPWYDSTGGMIDYVVVSNPNSNSVYYKIWIAGQQKATNPTIPAKSSVAHVYPATMGGPLKVQAGFDPSLTQPANVVTSQRATFGSSLEEVPGIPAGSIASSYLWPRYDSTGGATSWMLMLNPNAFEIYYEIRIADTVQRSGTIQPGQKVAPTLTSVKDGPVSVQAWMASDHQTPANVLATQRVLKNGYFNEILGQYR